MKACVIGWPISHSRSPIIHGHWIRALGLDASYERVPVEPDKLQGFIAGLMTNGYRGCNVTIPHKEAVFDLVTSADETTERLKAVNTVFDRDGRLMGTNTDGEGFIRNLRDQVPGVDLRNKKAVILGAGGAAASIIDILLREGMDGIELVNRSVERAESLRNRFGRAVKVSEWGRRSEALHEAAVLVNTTSLGMTGQPPLDIDLAGLPRQAVVADIVYSPLRTALLEQAGRSGHRVVEGLGMLLHQAVRGFELWFGVRPTVTAELYDLVARDIDGSYHR